jgi:hypothetical protein
VTTTLVPDDTYPWGVTPGVIDEDAISLYTNSQCHALAIALNQSHGYPIRLIAMGNDVTEKHLLTKNGVAHAGPKPMPTEDLINNWIHAVVMIGHDAFLDITGVQTDEELFSDWYSFMESDEDFEYLAFVSSTPEQIRASLDIPKKELAKQVALAQQFVAPLLASVVAK